MCAGVCTTTFYSEKNKQCAPTYYPHTTFVGNTASPILPCCLCMTMHIPLQLCKCVYAHTHTHCYMHLPYPVQDCQMHPRVESARGKVYALRSIGEQHVVE